MLTESWKTWLYRRFFSSLSGLTLSDWLALLAENECRVSPEYLPRAGFITLTSLFNSLPRLWEERRFRQAMDEVSIPDPLFILGHWRSGTTYLHQLLALDPRWHPPTMAEVMFPHSILTANPMISAMGWFLPADRGVDAVPLGTQEPFEDEFALAILSRRSPYLGWSFPSHQLEHEARLSLTNPRDEARWKHALRLFLAKLALKHGKPALLKSPPHTARIRHLIDLFPNARFVHIHRDPLTVFASTRRLLEIGIDGLRLQTSPNHDVIGEVIARYRSLYDRYFEDLDRIPESHRRDVAFEDLARDPLATLEAIDEHFGWKVTSEVVERRRAVLRTSKDYRMNHHPEVPIEIRQRLIDAWGPIYRRWGYEIEAC